MNETSIPAEEVPEGYVSHDAKKQFQMYAIIVGIVFGIAQFVVPMVFVFSTMFSQGFPFRPQQMVQPDVEHCVFWNDGVWYTEGSPGNSTSWLRRFDPAAKARGKPPENSSDSIPISMSTPKLLPDGDRLWLISSEKVGYVEDGETYMFLPLHTLGNTSRSFLHEGKPAVIEDKGDGAYALLTFHDEEWEDVGRLRMDFPGAYTVLENVRVVPIEGTLHLFSERGRDIIYREGLPEITAVDVDASQDDTPQEDEPRAAETPVSQDGADDTEDAQDRWTQIATSRSEWAALAIGGQPAIVLADSGRMRSTVGVLTLADGQWNEVLRHKVGFVTELGACALDDADRFAVLIQGFPGTFEYFEVEGTQVKPSTKFGNSSPFPIGNPFSMKMNVLPSVLVMGMALAAILIISWLMGQYREPTYRSVLSEVPYASLTRRAVAKGIDTLIVGVPFYVIMFLYMEDLVEAMQDLMGGAIARGGNFDTSQLGPLLGWFAAGFGFFCVGCIAICITEGIWGISPGKWVSGIRVVNINLKPCGVGMALIRNLLMIIDQFFNYLVGIMLIAFTLNRQRLGDMAARTVVLKVNHLEFAQATAEGSGENTDKLDAGAVPGSDPDDIFDV
jgi:uncharacterized RDD family membrane protein YckC